ncbi:alpha/beta hydrolase [Mycolicibacterium sp. 120270]|uniref:alpha/beta hydrolase n=1 Tax=Mycolicibacterium sp. 120270 TaxID=3090600 RepID=UPI00299F05F0|nr:alpha/beta hydrolase [Mycolicibacterium sp. 120270]MDX1884657.1 alpha/beta hydrolase [Mycolicibacterium sp. 120270]
MGDRFLLWLGAGAVCAGVTVGMLAGAGTAFAQTESDGGESAKTSQQAKTDDSQQDSAKPSKPSNDRPAFGRNAVKAINAVKDAVDDAVTKAAKAADGDGRATATAASNNLTATKSTTGPRPGQRATAFVNDVVAAVTAKPERTVVFERPRRTDPVDPVAEAEPVAPVAERTNVALQSVALAQPLAQQAQPQPLAQQAQPQPLAQQAQPRAAASASPTIDVPPVISAIGTAIFGLISLAESVFEGPPLALPGSGVTVKRSTLDLGDGHVVPADWYFPDTYDPESETPPERIIYLQHGFLARGVFYDYTASYLAQQTNSVVVAPTLTSNIFATDGMWLGGDPMHRAVADLFPDDNPALLESAQAAGYGQDELPQQVVLIGHSLGGGLVIDTARYMKQNGTSDKLAGVLMLDGVSFTDPVPILEDLEGIPVYNLSATPYVWNLFGSMDAALAQVRPTEFHGMQMLGGLHSDAMIGGNPLVQIGAYLLTGYGGPANVAGSQILAAGWINDMFVCQDDPACTRTGYYGDPGEAVEIPTPVGPAIGLVQPRQDVVTSFLQDVTGVFLGLLAHINFATDVEPAQETSVAV